MAYRLVDKFACTDGCCQIGSDPNFDPHAEQVYYAHVYGEQPMFQIKEDYTENLSSPDVRIMTTCPENEDFIL